MGAQELKYSIHESIENIDDEDFLKLIREILNRKYPNRKKPRFSAGDLEKIEISRDQVMRGKVKTKKQIDEMVSKWAKG